MSKVYALIMEWDGQKPSTTFYARRNKLCDLKVRGDKELAVLARRARENVGLILQEGCIVSTSESLIDTLAYIAEEEASKQGISITTMVIEGEMRPRKTTPEIYSFFKRVQDVFGMRGRKPDPDTFVVTCLERLETYVIEAVGVAVTPKGSLNFNVVKTSSPKTYKVPKTPQEYVESRFTFGKFIIGEYNNEKGLDYTGAVVIETELSNKLIPIIEGLKHGKLPPLSSNGEMMIIDAVVAARLHYSEESVMKARIEAVTKYFLLGGSPTKVSIMVDKNIADVLDGAAVVGPQLAAEWAMKLF